MVESIVSLERLYNIIEDDRKDPGGISSRRFPIRFIFVNSFEELRDLVKFLSEKGIKIVDLSERLPGNDLWVTTNEIVSTVKEIREDAVVVPLSEFLRFQNADEFYSTLASLAEIENRCGNMRIYVPLVGLWERFEQEFWNNFNRRNEWAPVWRLETESRKVLVFQLGFDLECDWGNISGIKVVSNAKEWLNIWKSERIGRVISLSNPISHFCKNFLPDQVFELKIISNHKEFLEEIFEMKVPIEFKDDEGRFWDRFVESVIDYRHKGLTMEGIFLSHFNLGDFGKLTPKDFLDLYLNSDDDYGRWLVRNAFLASDRFKEHYLFRCFEKLQKLDSNSMIENLWLEIFRLQSEGPSANVFDDRRDLLKHVHEDPSISTRRVEEKLARELGRLDELPLRKKVDYLTGITFTEKKYLISELKESKISSEEIISIVEQVYPNLAYYLDWDVVQCDCDPDADIGWIFEYFKAYNYSKVMHSKSPEIDKILGEKNKNKETFSKWYYSLPLVNIRKECEYIWVDGLGAEWFPLLTHLLNKYGREYGKVIKEEALVRVHLPSTTECNQYSFEKIGDLDDYIHGRNTYTHPGDLIKEIEIVERIAKKIVELPYDEVGIISDHGFSFLCLGDFSNSKRLSFSEAEHEGRCMRIEKGHYADDEYYIVWNVDGGSCRGKKYLLALKHISLNDTPRREVHGGATPEEVIVPFVLLGPERSQIEYSVDIFDSEVQVTNPIFRFKVSPPPKYIPEAYLGSRSLKVLRDETGVYSINLKGLKPGTYTIVLKIGATKHQLDFVMRGGFRERDII